MASSPSQTLPGTQARRTGKLKKISLIPFVAILYAYCAGGPFDYEAMVSTSGPGMALLFILIVPWLFSVPMALASADEADAQFSSRACDRCSTGGGNLLLAHGRRFGSTGQLAGMANGVSGHGGPYAGREQHGPGDVCRSCALRLCAA